MSEFHHFVGFFLSNEFASIIVLFYQVSVDVPGIDDPNKRGDDTTHKEHNGFLFNYSIRMRINVMKSDIFDYQSHEGGGEKQADHLF